MHRVAGWSLLVTVSLTACGDPLGVASPTPPSDLPPGVDAPGNAHGQTHELVAAGESGPCSAAAIDVGGGPEAPAYVLTAGHCIERRYWQPNDIEVDVPADNFKSFSGNDFYDTAPIEAPIARIEYATMHLQDVAILRLDSTNAELLATHITPLQLAKSEPAPGDPIAIVGHPNGDSLRRSRCNVGTTTYLAEDEFLFREVSDDCAGVAPGSSGSPVLNAELEVVGVLSTASGDQHPCALDNPCDLSKADLANPDGVVTYYTNSIGLLGCFADGRFTLDADSCPLPKPPLQVATRGVERYTQSTTLSRPNWDVRLRDSPLPYYRFKAGKAQETRCDDEKGYGAPYAVAETPTIEEPLSTEEGLYLLCVQGGTATDTFSPPNVALGLLTEVDNTPPQAPPESELFPSVQPDGFVVQLALRPPDIVKFFYRMQRTGESDCALRPTDEEVKDDSGNFHVDASDPRRELCVTVEDAAGNRSSPLRASPPAPSR